MSIISIPCTSLRASRTSLYTRREGYATRRRARWAELLKDCNSYEVAKKAEALSKKAASRLRDKIMLLVDCSATKRVYSDKLKSYFNFKVNFITLTLPSKQMHSDKVIHEKVFKEFIRAWKRMNADLLYVWKAETQANGNLHYHLITNSFIHHSQLRRMWNFYCEKLGYCTRSKSEDPNSTDIHAVKNIKDIAAYAVKYMSKKSEGRRVPSIRKWHCSSALLLPHPVLEGSTPASEAAFTVFFNNNVRVWISNYCTCFFTTRESLKLVPRLSQLYEDYIATIKRTNRNLKE